MESSEEERWLNEGEEKVDRQKIESIEKTLQRYIDQIKQGSFKFSQDAFHSLEELTGEELLNSKITNRVNFILNHLKKGPTLG